MSKISQMHVREIGKFLRVADIDRIEIYRDGSGSLMDSTGNEMASFDDTQTMFEALVDLLPTSMSAEQKIISQLRTEDNS